MTVASRAAVRSAAGCVRAAQASSGCGGQTRAASRTASQRINHSRRQSTWSDADAIRNRAHNDGHPPPPHRPQQQQQTHSYQQRSSNPQPGPSRSAASEQQRQASGSETKAAQEQRPKRPLIVDPLELVGRELSSLRSNISSLLGSGHPALDTIAKYYFQTEGKHVRPLIVLLMARAVNAFSPTRDASKTSSSTVDALPAKEFMHEAMGIDEPLSPKDILNDYNPHMDDMEAIEGMTPRSGFDASTAAMQDLATEETENHILPTQRRLAEITEMIHVASLLHDDVIDASELRRGTPSAPAAFGNKLSILAGDFLLARASVALARLRNNEVLELLASVIANLVEGEVMQLQPKLGKDGRPVGPVKSAFSSLWEGVPGAAASFASKDADKAAPSSESPDAPTMDMFENYLQKTYLKTASLIGKSARAATILGGFGADAIRAKGLGSEAQHVGQTVRDAAYTYGRNLGIAFQLVDDLLDFKATSAAFGKPSGGADLRLGLTTAPVLFAWQEMPHEGLGTLVARKFSADGDVPRALDIVRRSQGLQRTSELAQHHAQLATAALRKLPPSEARDALQQLNEQIINRVK